MGLRQRKVFMTASVPPAAARPEANRGSLREKGRRGSLRRSKLLVKSKPSLKREGCQCEVRP